MNADFLSDVAMVLIPGKYAVLADVEEEWVTPLDRRMEDLGGVVFRTVKTHIEEERRARDNAALRAQIEQLKAECAKALSDRK